MAKHSPAKRQVLSAKKPTPTHDPALARYPTALAGLFRLGKPDDGIDYTTWTEASCLVRAGSHRDGVG